jgi:hypothetical protein
MFSKTPDDPEIEDMDPYMKYWMYMNWLEDHNDEFELHKNIAMINGSFVNPEAVKKMMGADGKQFISTDEEFEESLEMISKEREEIKNKVKHRRKRKFLE